MSIRWKLLRINSDKRSYDLPEGECTIGRLHECTISLPSTFVSRQHCVIRVNKNSVILMDSQSSNGTYVNNEKISYKTEVELKELSIIGIGWKEDLDITTDIPENELFVFQLVREVGDLFTENNNIENNNTIKNEPCESENHFKVQNGIKVSNAKQLLLENLRIDNVSKGNSFKNEKRCDDENNIANAFSLKNDDECIITHSNDNHSAPNKNQNEIELSPPVEIKCEKKNLKRYHCENSKQGENITPFKRRCENDVLIISDSDDEDDISFEPNKFPPIEFENSDDEGPKINIASITIEDDDDIPYDIIKRELDSEAISMESDDSRDADLWLSRLSQSHCSEIYDNQPVKTENNEDNHQIDVTDNEVFLQDIIKLPLLPVTEKTGISIERCSIGNENLKSSNDPNIIVAAPKDETHKGTAIRKTKFIEPIASTSKSTCNEPKQKSLKKVVNKPREKTNRSSSKSEEGEPKQNSLKKVAKKPREKTKRSSSKSEERKKKLLEIAIKNQSKHEETELSIPHPPNDTNKPKVCAKITTVNRSAFLIQENQKKPCEVVKNKKPHVSESNKSRKDELVRRDPLGHNNENNDDSNASTSLNNNKNQSEIDKSAGNVKLGTENVSHKVNQKKKSIKFSTLEPEIREFQIEPGNHFRYSVKDIKPHQEQHSKQLALDRQYIMRILKWNTNWLKEKATVNNKQLPDLTGRNVMPSHIFHKFSSHSKYVSQIGHLLLIDIWDTLATECGTNYDQVNMFKMRVESISSHNRGNDSHQVILCVNFSLPKTYIKDMPVQKDLLILRLKPEVSKFLYVHEITVLPSPPNNIYNFYSIQLHGPYSEKLKNLQRGEVVYAKRLINMHSYMILFQAMQTLSTSPLCEIVLNPQPHHFTSTNDTQLENEKMSKWTHDLNGSQLKAVQTIVAAALSEKPSISMVQGPPGTGKSSVVCSILMAYFYGHGNRRIRQRGKILICANSNAAVDALVIRLLDIRQNLPQEERFRMVRVGRDEVMHPNVRGISLKRLAERNPAKLTRNLTPPSDDHNTIEMNTLESKENMWRNTLENTTDPGRRAFCQSQLAIIHQKRQKLMGNLETGSVTRSLTDREREVVLKADIIATTLTSVSNPRMQCLKNMVTLCIVDEAGQAIEPVSLIPLTLGVTRFALIGDPQQLPGFTRSQIAKDYGLGESLFSRLSSCDGGGGGGGPAMLLNVQYRMHPQIADYPNRAFYSGNIHNVYTPRPDLRLPPYNILFMPGCESYKPGGAQTMNEREAWAVARLAAALHHMLQPKRMSLAVISPYVAQREIIKSKLRTMMGNTDELPVEVNTVDSFQGQERDVVVVSLARRHGVGFLQDAGRMNVMLTRAKHSLLICVDPNALQNNMQWRTLLEDAKKRKLCRYLPEKLCRPTTAERQKDDVLRFLIEDRN